MFDVKEQVPQQHAFARSYKRTETSQDGRIIQRLRQRAPRPLHFLIAVLTVALLLYRFSPNIQRVLPQISLEPQKPVTPERPTTSVTPTTTSCAGPLQTVPQFFSSVFDPVFVTTTTYAALSPTCIAAGAWRGLGVVDCPSSNGTRYTARTGAKFTKQCYQDFNGVRDIGRATVGSLEDCIEACADWNGPAVSSKRLTCKAVAYGANIELGVREQGANCWLKASHMKPSPGDWQQATATLVEEE